VAGIKIDTTSTGCGSPSRFETRSIDDLTPASGGSAAGRNTSQRTLPVHTAPLTFLDDGRPTFDTFSAHILLVLAALGAGGAR
jgi:hypothetical protein